VHFNQRGIWFADHREKCQVLSILLHASRLLITIANYSVANMIKKHKTAKLRYDV